MKYISGKIKKEHHILKEFQKFIEEIEKIPTIQKIIPWRIYRQQSGSSHKTITFSYFTISWMKFNLKKGSTAQELFIVCNENDKENTKIEIEKIIKKTWK